MSFATVMQNLFGGAPAPAAPAANQNQPTQPGNLPAAPTQQMQSDPANVNAPAASTTPEPQGLDAFTDIWKPVESPAGTQNTDQFNVDPKQFIDAAKKVDFTKVINPQQLQAIAAGGEDAMKAFAAAINSVAQASYAQSAMASTEIAKRVAEDTRTRVLAEIPQHIRNQSVSDSLRNDNPALSHPAAAPILGALQQQLTLKHPNATTGEISKMAKDYLTQFAGLVAPQPQNQQESQTQSKGEMDWSQYLN